MPRGPGSWSQEHRWAAPARAFGWSAPVGAWFLAPHPLASSIACLASGSRDYWGHSAGLCLGLAFCGGCNWCIWRPTGRQMHQQCFSLRHQRPLRQSAEEAPPLHGFVPAWLERFLEHQKPCVLVHFHESPTRLHRFVERSRSEAGKHFGIVENHRSRLLHLDVGLSRCAADSRPA